MVQKKKKKKKTKVTIPPIIKMLLILIMFPATIGIYILVYAAWQELQELPFFQELTHRSEMDIIQSNFDMEIPVEYIPIYMEAGEKYNVPWTLLAAHHRIETRFSTMRKLVSPVGAEGHLQFMPCTFVGWEHPTCSGLGEGSISEEDKTDPAVIAKYGGYGVDANGDGVADPFDIEDAVYSAANFLSIAGASKGNIEKAIFQYNHSEEYVEDVLHYYNLYSSYREKMELVLASSDF
jgi:peptidoglycan LD-endopeptidase LytH